MTPIAYFDDIWQRCAEIEAFHSYLATNLVGVMTPDELLRAEWVIRVSALDLYVHEAVAQNMLKIFQRVRPSCPGFARFKFSGEALIRIHNAPTHTDACAAFDLEVKDTLSRITYQFPEDIADGIRLISDCELWNEISLMLGATPETKSTDAKALKRSLSLIVERRNKIVHEGDLQPAVPRTPWPINRTDVDLAKTVIHNIVRAIDKII